YCVEFRGAQCGFKFRVAAHDAERTFQFCALQLAQNSFPSRGVLLEQEQTQGECGRYRLCLLNGNGAHRHRSFPINSKEVSGRRVGISFRGETCTTRRNLLLTEGISVFVSETLKSRTYTRFHVH